MRAFFMASAFRRFDSPEYNGALRFGFICVCIFLTGMFSAGFELIRPLHVIRPALLCSGAGLLALIMSGRAPAVLDHSISRGLIALTVWWIICIPFAVWPGGAAHTLTDQWVTSILTFFLVGGLVATAKQSMTIVHLIGYASTFLALNALRVNSLSLEGRLGMRATRYGNPNDLAMVLLCGLPFLALMVIRPGSMMRRLIGVAGFAAAMLAMSKTGSRGAMLGAVCGLVVVLANMSMANRIKSLAVVTVAFCVLMPFIPESLRSRFTTFFKDDTVHSDQESAQMIRSSIESAYSRKMLLMDSITLTFKNPIFGVGPGMFPVAQDDLARERGEKMGNWHVTHNTYTEVSSESGFIGLGIYLFILFHAFRSLKRARSVRLPVYSKEMNDLQLVALAMKTSMVSFVTCMFFSSMAYLPFMSVMLGVSVAVEYSASYLLQQARQTMNAQQTAGTSASGSPQRFPQGRRGAAGQARPLPAFPRALPEKA
jgi:hypothetical protein